jgi:hypothetical protein
MLEKVGEDQLNRSCEKCKYYTELRRRGILYKKQKEGRLNRMVAFCEGTAVENTLL